jgi:hypothetical protein
VDILPNWNENPKLSAIGKPIATLDLERAPFAGSTLNGKSAGSGFGGGAMAVSLDVPW